jgi:hypothetical protein
VVWAKTGEAKTTKYELSRIAEERSFLFIKVIIAFIKCKKPPLYRRGLFDFNLTQGINILVG